MTGEEYLLLKEMLKCLQYQNKLTEEIYMTIDELKCSKGKANFDEQISLQLGKMRGVLAQGPGGGVAVEVFDNLMQSIGAGK